MATDMAAIVNPGLFRAKKKNSEKMLEDFKMYMEAFTNILIVTDDAGAGQEKKNALLNPADSLNMAYLFKHIGKVPEAAKFDEAITTVHAGITDKPIRQ